MRKPFDDEDEDDDDLGPDAIPAEAAGVALHRSISKKHKKLDEDEEEGEGSEDHLLDEDDIEALGG